jgi:hypothetical protein
LKSVEDASRISFEETNKDLQSLQSNFNATKTVMQKLLEGDDPSLEHFKSVMPAFFEQGTFFYRNIF